MRAFPSITIIFPTFNGWKDTKEFLNSILKLDYPKEKLEIIVVDNASTDGTVDKIKDLYHLRGGGVPRFAGGDTSEVKKEANSRKTTIRLIENKTNLGFAKAVNLGVKMASSQLILITNNDVTFEKNCLKELVKIFLSNPKIGGVGGKVTWKNQNRLSIDGFRLNPYLGYHQFDLSGLNQKRECEWVSGNCLLTRRKLFLEVGGFDQGYFFYFEDIDLSLRLRKAGLKLFYVPQAIAHHKHGATIFKEGLERIFYLGYHSRWRCLFKNATLAQILSSSVFLLIFSPLYQSYKTRHNAFKPMLKGLLDNLKGLLGNAPKYDLNDHPFPSYSAINLTQKYLSPSSLVLDVGCNRGQTGKILKDKTGCQVVGIDNCQEAVKEARKVLDKVILTDIELESLDLDQKLFDLIILSNILEHLKDPFAVLKNLKKFLKADGYFLIAVPNVAFWHVRLDLLFGKFNYQEVGILGKDHLRFFTLKTLTELLEKTSLKIVESTTNYLGWRNSLASLWPTLLSSQFVLLCKKN